MICHPEQSLAHRVRQRSRRICISGLKMTANPEHHARTLGTPSAYFFPVRSPMDNFRQNLRLAMRQLTRNPGFTLTVLFTLALAIGANTAIFSIVNVLLLKSLPYAHPERIGTIFLRVQGTKPVDDPHNPAGTHWQLLRDN